MQTRIAFDRASARTMDENGFLHVALCNISKETVNPYYGREIPGWEKEGLDPEKIYNGYRPGIELERGAATFNGLPVLFDHKVDSAAAPQKLLRVGSVGTDAGYAAPYLKATLTFTDAEAIQAIEGGKKVELSCAYFYDPIFEPGEFEGRGYDFKMTNIRGNHVALVEEGRAGSDVVVADSKPKPKNGATTMKKLKTTLLAGVAKLRALAMDEGLDPEKVENALAVIGAEVQKAEGGADPAKAEGQDADPKSALIAMVNALEIDDAKKKELLAAIEGLGVDGDPDAQDEGEEKKPEAAKDEDKPGEKPEEEKQPGMDKKTVLVMDAAQVRKEVLGDIQATLEAKELGERLCGKLVVDLAQDSAEDIYGKVLTMKGIDIKGHPKSAYRSMVVMLDAQAKSPAPAMDSRPAASDLKDTPFANLGKIKIGQ
jgi:hypothetical protein